jgi:hypothetical protein
MTLPDPSRSEPCAPASPIATPPKRKGRKPGARMVALRDQVATVLREAEGFPLRVSQIRKELGMQQVDFRQRYGDIDRGTSFCARCRGFHGSPVWRYPDETDVRTVLLRMERDGEAGRDVPEGSRVHYWRSVFAGGAQ